MGKSTKGNDHHAINDKDNRQLDLTAWILVHKPDIARYDSVVQLTWIR